MAPGKPRRIPGVLVTATGTSAGKTFVARGLARALVRRGIQVVALKPVETGCAPDPLDAIALGRAAGRPELAHAAGFHRAREALAPYAIELEGGSPAPDVATLAELVQRAAGEARLVIVEGAGGLAAPLRRGETFADLAALLSWPLVVVAPDQLGVLSFALTLAECARGRDLSLAALVLAALPGHEDDPSRRSNGRILSEALPCPVLRFPRCDDDDDALAAAAEAAGLVEQVLARAMP